MPSHSFSFSFISHSSTSVSFSRVCSCHLCGAGFCLSQFEGVGREAGKCQEWGSCHSWPGQKLPSAGWGVTGLVVRSVKALGAACCLQGEDPVLQGSALICWSGFCALWRCCWSPCEVAAGAAVSCWHSPSSVSLSGQAPSPPHQPVSLFPLLPVTPVLLLEPQLCLSLWLCYLLTTRMESSVSHRLN